MTCFEQIMREVVGLESTLVRKLLDPRLAALIEVSRVVTSLLEAADALSGEFPDLARRCGEMASELTDAKGRARVERAVTASQDSR